MGRTAAAMPCASVQKTPPWGWPRGTRPIFSRTSDGQMKETHSIAAGLDYIGVSPILSDFMEAGKARFTSATDTEVVNAMALTIKKEGVVPALESAHAFAGAFREVSDLPPDQAVIINQSGRGDKDIFTVADAFDDPEWKKFIIQKARSYEAQLSGR